MCKKLILLITLILAIVTGGNLRAATITWDGQVNHDWSTANNWDTNTVPLTTDIVNLLSGAASPYDVVVDADEGKGDTINIGNGGLATISSGGIMTAGTGIMVGYGTPGTGVLTLNSGGTVSTGNYMYVGYTGNGQININGGSISLGWALTAPYNNSYTGKIYLNGGSLSVPGGLTMDSNGLIDINSPNSRVTFGWNIESSVADCIKKNYIVAYGGYGEVVLTRESQYDPVVLKAVFPDEMLARMPSPYDTQKDVAVDSNLIKWVPSSDATKQDVYFGTTYSSVDSATDPNTSPGKGRQDANSYAPGALTYGQTYYWRVDEVVGSYARKGNVWSFTAGMRTSNWTHAGADHLWSTSGSWSTNAVPTSTDSAHLDSPSSADPNHPIIQAGISAVCNNIIGGTAAGTAKLNITGGSLTASDRIELGSMDGNTLLLMSGGTVSCTDLLVGKNGEGSITMSGGTITVNKKLSVPADINGVGTIDISAGKIDCNEFSMNANGLIDLSGGTLIVPEDLNTVNQYIANGWITAYDGRASVSASYSDANKETTITAGAVDLEKSWDPDPVNNVRSVALNASLSWAAGAGVSSHNVYLGTNSASLPIVSERQVSTTYTPGASLTANTQYYWRVDEVNENAKDTVTKLGSWTASATTHSHTAEAGSNRLLILTAHVEDNDANMSLNSVTYGGQTMTKVIEKEILEVADRAYVAVFILKESGIAAATSNAFAFSWSSTPDRHGYTSVFLSGVDQNTPTGATDSNSSNTAATITTGLLVTSNSDMVIAAATAGNTGTYTVNNSFTKATEVTITSADGVAGYKSATGASEAASVTHTSPQRQVVVGMVVKAGFKTKTGNVWSFRTKGLVIENNYVRLDFDSTTGALMSLKNLVTGDEYIKTIGGAGNPFRAYVDMTSLPPALTQGYPYPTQDVEGAMGGTLVDPCSCRLISYSTSRENNDTNVLQIVSNHSSKNLDFTLEVRLPDNNTIADFNLVVENNSVSDHNVMVAIPYLTGLGLGATSSTNQCVRPVDYGQSRAAAWVMSSTIHGQERSMQWDNIYESNPALNETLGIITKDPNLQTKIFHRFTPNGTSVLYADKKHLTAGLTARYPTAELIVNEGDWKTTARLYKTWFESAFTLRQRPAWFDDDVMQYIGINWGNLPFLEMPKTMLTYRFNDVVEIWGWWDDCVGGLYEPNVTYGGPNDFTAGLVKAYNIGRYPALYVASKGMDMNSPLLDGNDANNFLWKDTAGTTPSSYFFCCLGYTPWKNHLIETVTRCVQDYGAKIVRLDEFAEFFLPCYNAAHNHASPYDSTTWIMSFLHDLRVAVDAIDPNAVILTEGARDACNQYIDSSLNMWSAGPDISPGYLAMPNFRGICGHPGAAEGALNGWITAGKGASNGSGAWWNAYHDPLWMPGLEKKPNDYNDYGPQLCWRELADTFKAAITDGDVTDVNPVVVNPVLDADELENWAGRMWTSADYWLMVCGHRDATDLNSPMLIKLPTLPAEMTLAYEFNTETLEMTQRQLIRNSDGDFVKVSSGFAAVFFPGPNCPPIVTMDSDIPFKKGSTAYPFVAAAGDVNVTLSYWAPWDSTPVDPNVTITAPGLTVNDANSLSTTLPREICLSAPADANSGDYFIKVTGENLPLKWWMTIK